MRNVCKCVSFIVVLNTDFNLNVMDSVEYQTPPNLCKAAVRGTSHFLNYEGIFPCKGVDRPYDHKGHK